MILDGTAPRRSPCRIARRPLPQTLILTIVATLLTVGCGGGGGGATTPTAPAGSPGLSLSTDHGTLTVQPNGHDIDLGAVERAVNRGYAKARAQIGSQVDGLRIDGYRVEVMPSSWDLYGQHLRGQRVIRVRAGDERVMAHELQHVFAWELHRPEDCKVLQDHPGGYDLHCSPLP